MTSRHPTSTRNAPEFPTLSVAPGFPTGRVLLTALAALAVAGCDNCGRSRPYTPFAADSSLPLPTTAPSAPPVASSAPTDPPQVSVEARRLEPPVGRFDVEGRSIELPKQMVAVWSLERDYDQDGKLDSLVWSRPDKVDANWTGPLGELWYFPTSSNARQLFVLPGFVPGGEGCNLDTRLRGLDSDFAWFEVTANCKTSLPQRAPVGAKVLLSPAAVKPVVLGLRVAQTAPGESIEIAPNVSDRDNDGRKDPALEFTLNVAEPRSSARMALGWLDRAAGVSRDDAYLNASVDTLLKTWEKRLTKKSKAQDLDQEMGAFVRLVGSVCHESATPRIWNLEGEPLRCNLSKAHRARVARIDVEQALLRGDFGGALLAYTESGSWLSAVPAVEREALRKRVAKSFAVVQTNLPVAVTARPKPRAQQLRYSPLRFENDDSLLVQTANGGLERVKLDGTQEPVDLDATTPWPLDVMGPDGSQWTGVVPSCDRSELLLTYASSGGSILLQPTPLLAPRPGVCKFPTRWPVAVSPIAYTTNRPVAIVRSVCLAEGGFATCQAPTALGPVTPGSPRSPDGKRLVFVSPLGPIVYGGAKPERWENAAFDTDLLTDCVVANEAKAIACVQSGKLLLVARAATLP